MRPQRRTPFAAVVLLVIIAPSTFGAPLPSFNLDACAWFATHVVLVTEGKKIDGVVEVLECWKGDLKKGDILTLPELADFASEESRTIRRRFDASDEGTNRP